MKVYICGTDLLYFRPDADITMYTTLEAARARLNCADDCGVVELDLNTDVKRWVVPEKPVSEWSNESRVDRMGRRLDLRCSFCPPNRGENATRKPKHGAKKKRRTK